MNAGLPDSVGHQAGVWEPTYVPAASQTLESLLAVGCRLATKLQRTGEKAVGFVLLRSSPKAVGINWRAEFFPGGIRHRQRDLLLSF